MTQVLAAGQSTTGAIVPLRIAADGSLLVSSGAANLRAPIEIVLVESSTTLAIAGLSTDPSWLVLRVVQDDTGDRALVIAGAKTPGATPLVLSTAPGSVDLVFVLWDGVQLYAQIGGLGFA